MTSEAIANAFKEPLKLNNEAKSRIEKHYSDDVVTRARLKMAKLPAKVANLSIIQSALHQVLSRMFMCYQEFKNIRGNA